MKRSLIFTLLTSLMLSAAPAARLTVHEWGTFTVLHDSGGHALRWYLPYQDQSPLPPFVHRPERGFKAAADGLALARMETPVLYFYPEEEMLLSVKAALPAGGLSEWFPNALIPTDPPASLWSGKPSALQWIGRLLPPASALAQQIPHTSDAPGQHYEAARAVPEAWLFQSNLPLPPHPATAAAPPPQIDHLIFYRGAADLSLPLQAAMEDDHTCILTGTGDAPIPVLFAVQTTTTGLAWVRLEALAKASYAEGKNIHEQRLTFPNSAPLGTTVPALRSSLTGSLVTAGLSPSEAAAMVSTWQDLWFQEIGTRVLALLPEAWVQQTVPLEINPAPTQLQRVYVARLEILTPARENALLNLLTAETSPTAAAPVMQKLALGRFAEGAFTRAQAQFTARLHDRLTMLLASAAKAP